MASETARCLPERGGEQRSASDHREERIQISVLAADPEAEREPGPSGKRREDLPASDLEQHVSDPAAAAYRTDLRFPPCSTEEDPFLGGQTGFELALIEREARPIHARCEDPDSARGSRSSADRDARSSGEILGLSYYSAVGPRRSPPPGDRPTSCVAGSRAVGEHAVFETEKAADPHFATYWTWKTNERLRVEGRA